MCLGIPMRIIDIQGTVARCTGRGIERTISLALLDPPAPGTWVLVDRDSAIQTLSETDAALIDQALDAVTAVQSGASVDHLFADLVDRAPQLPAHLRPEEPS